jgi:hypothetical protein
MRCRPPGTSGSFGWWRPTRAGSRGIGEAFAAIPVEHRRRGRRSLGSHTGRPSVSRVVASLGAFTGTLRIGDRLRVLRLLAAGVRRRIRAGPLWATNAWSGMTALGQRRWSNAWARASASHQQADHAKATRVRNLHRVPPLASPTASPCISAREALSFPAVQLFAEHAARALGKFELSDADAPLVAEICRKLDGIPLAIQLAAGHIGASAYKALPLEWRIPSDY